MSLQTESLVDQVLFNVGDNGRYQKLLLWTFLIPLNLIVPWTALVPIFQTSVPDHWCRVPGQPTNITLEKWKNLTIPWTKKDGKMVRSKCEQYNVSHILREYETSANSSKVDFIIGCQNGWEFDNTWYDRTLPMDQNWVCDRDSFSARWLSAGVAGNVVGTIIFNCLSDYYGRKPIVILTTQVYAVFSIARLFSNSAWSHIILIFLAAMSFPANLEISFIYVMEQVAGDMRAQITSVTFITWTIGMCLLPLLAWLTRHWIVLGIVTSLPFVPFFIIWWFFPESPRWLLSSGREAEAAKVFEHIASLNGKKKPEDLRETLQKILEVNRQENPPRQSYLTFVELFRYPVVRTRLLLLTICYACNGLMYYAIVFNTSNLSGNEFLNFFFLSISELPGNFLAWFCAQKFGRKYSEAGFLFLATLVAGAAIFTMNDSWVQVFILVTCKTLSNISFLIVYIQLAEILPTTHRSSGTGFTSLLASIIGISSPYIAYSGSQWPFLPYVILVLIGLTGTITALFLPETMGESLPQTVSDAEQLAKDQPFWAYRGWRPQRKMRESSRQEMSSVD